MVYYVLKKRREPYQMFVRYPTFLFSLCLPFFPTAFLNNRGPYSEHKASS